MRRLLAYLLAVLIVGSLFFGWGYRRGAASVEMRDSTVTRWVPWPVPVYDTIREPYPVAVREPADTVWKYMSVDTAAIIADYLLERDYRLDFSADSTGTFLVDATVGENRLLRASAVVSPLSVRLRLQNCIPRCGRRAGKWDSPSESIHTTSGRASTDAIREADGAVRS